LWTKMKSKIGLPCMCPASGGGVYDVDHRYIEVLLESHLSIGQN
jgi:hypothetical protein